jgi:hypothetical protein
MGNLLNRIYDFFAFSLPGACLIIAVLIFPYNQDLLIYHKLPWTGIGVLNKLLIIALAGYLVGYIITPLSRHLILRHIAIPFCRCFTLITKHKLDDNKKEEIRDEYKELISYLFHKNLSHKFVKIRNKRIESAHYIEFWDMHITMASNLALASVILVILQLINWTCLHKPVFIICPWAFVIAGVLAFFLLLNIAVKYSRWWVQDIQEAAK